jgi:hypothetical protein
VGSAVAQARVRARIRSCGICGRHNGTQADFLRVLHTHHHQSSSGAGTIGQIMANVPSGLILPPPQDTKAMSSGACDCSNGTHYTTGVLLPSVSTSIPEPGIKRTERESNLAYIRVQWLGLREVEAGGQWCQGRGQNHRLESSGSLGIIPSSALVVMVMNTTTVSCYRVRDLTFTDPMRIRFDVAEQPTLRSFPRQHAHRTDSRVPAAETVCLQHFRFLRPPQHYTTLHNTTRHSRTAGPRV